MSPSIPALVEPSVLRWARESIGLTPLAAARKLHVPDGRVDEWERSDSHPTVAQLRALATLYKRPLGVFFLSEPPNDFDAMHDFRRLGTSAATDWSPELHGEYRRAQAQRGYAIELAELEDEQFPTTWRLDHLPGDDEAMAKQARVRLLHRAPLSLPEGSGTAYDHLNVWTAAMEEAGILVLATQRGGVDLGEMRAFSLYYDMLPVVVVNGSDTARGRLFSLLHEYAHLLIRTSGLCDTVTDLQASTTDRGIEARCNAIAAAILMPEELMRSLPSVVSREVSPESWDYESLRSAAVPFGVSAEAFLRRLLTLGRVSRSFYQTQREEFLAAYEAEVGRSRGGGGDWYRTTVRDLGKGYVRRVADAHRRKVIDSYTAASYLNVKVEQIPRLALEAALRVST